MSRKSLSRAARFRKRVSKLLEKNPRMETKEILASTKRFDLAPSSKRREIGKVKREQGYRISPRAPVRAREFSMAKRKEQTDEWGRTGKAPPHIMENARFYNMGKGLPLNDSQGVRVALGVYQGKTIDQAVLDAIEGTV